MLSYLTSPVTNMAMNTDVLTLAMKYVTTAPTTMAVKQV